jgi:4-hydroxy-4-methyl-2-oxoglutarate aldolase
MTSEQPLADRLAACSAPTLFEAGPGVRCIGPQLTPLFRPIRLAGPAFTALAAPGDNLAIHRALAVAPAGSVLVVAAGGDVRYGFWGEIMMEAALVRGLRGLVIDGAVRDSRALRERAFPVFSAGVAIPGAGKQWAGALNVPVIVGQTVVHPGDFIVGDDDGLVVIPAENARAVLERALARDAKEEQIIARLRAGATTMDLFGLRGPES